MEFFTRIPNSLWYGEGERFRSMGGGDGFILYTFLASRKGMDGRVLTSTGQIMKVLEFCVNRQRHKKRVLKALKALEDEKMIVVRDGNPESINDVLEVEWLELSGVGWVRFFASDFDWYHKIGRVPFLVMWVLRSFTNGNTGRSFVSIERMSTLLDCGTKAVQEAVHFFRREGIFTVESGGWYYSRTEGKRIRANNQYQYGGSSAKTIKIKEYSENPLT